MENNKLRPLHICILITRGDIGGAQVSVYNLAYGLQAIGHQVTVATGNTGNFLENKLAEKNIPVHRFSSLTRSYNPIKNYQFFCEAKTFFENNHFDIVHINSTNALFAAKAIKQVTKKTKTVFTFRGLSVVDAAYTKNPLTRYSFRTYFRWLLRHIDMPVYVSKANQTYGKSIGLTTIDAMVYNGLNRDTLSFLSREDARQALGRLIDTDISSSSFVFGSIGRLAYQKHYEALIRQMARISPNIPKPCHCIIIGDGPEAQKLEQLATDLRVRDRVHFVGAIPDASQYMKGFDYFVLPSLYEGFSITLIETLFAGIATISSNVGGNSETLGDSGRLYELEDEDALGDHLLDVLCLPVHAITTSHERASKRANTFSISHTVQGYLQIYSNLTTSSNADTNVET